MRCIQDLESSRLCQILFLPILAMLPWVSYFLPHSICLSSSLKEVTQNLTDQLWQLQEKMVGSTWVWLLVSFAYLTTQKLNDSKHKQHVMAHRSLDLYEVLMWPSLDNLRCAHFWANSLLVGQLGLASLEQLHWLIGSLLTVGLGKKVTWLCVFQHPAS